MHLKRLSFAWSTSRFFLLETVETRLPFGFKLSRRLWHGNAVEKNCREQILKKLASIEKGDIVITPHAGMRAAQRNIGMEEIYGNLLNPSKLVFAEYECETEDGKKYCCYFDTSKKRFNLYVIVINNNVTVVTVFEANKKLQKRVEKNAKIPL